MQRHDPRHGFRDGKRVACDEEVLDEPVHRDAQDQGRGLGVGVTESAKMDRSSSSTPTSMARRPSTSAITRSRVAGWSASDR